MLSKNAKPNENEIISLLSLYQKKLFSDEN